MRTRFLARVVTSFLAVFLFVGQPEVQNLLAAEDWPQFRGPDGQGHADARDLPITWSESENITWKTAIAGLGLSSPVIGGQQIWLTTALDDGKSLRVVCLDRTTGKVVHDVEVFPNNKPVPLTPPNSHASPTAILDGDRLYVHFGAYGTACLTTDGKIVWKAKMEYRPMYGPSSTPVLYQDLLIIPCQGTNVRFMAALDKKTGEVRWKQPHQGRNSDSTPLVIHRPSGDQLVCNLAEKVVSYDPATGKELWSVQQGNNYAQVPRPVFGYGLVFIAGGYFDPVVQAIRPDGQGDVTKTHVAWSMRHSSVPQNPSPLLVGNELYLVSDKGIGSCLDARTGKVHWRERLGQGFYASPLFADGRLYVSSQEGVTTVLAPGKEFKKLAVNKLDGRMLASLAVSGKSLYLRTDRHLYRIEKRAGDAAGFVPATGEEPLAKEFSLERAARSLDASALDWQKGNQCSQCHANFMYLVARPALASIVPPPPEVRGLYESLVSGRWEKQGLRYASEAMVVAVPLACNDQQTTGKLNPLTRKALDRMLTHQRPDGGWNGIGGAARTFINEYEETLLAGIGIACAPLQYAQTEPARKALEGIRQYAKARPPQTPYQKGMLLWAGHHVEGLMNEAERQKAAKDLLALQRPDGGWSLRSLLHDSEEWQSGKFAAEQPSDGYGTGFVLFAARLAGVPSGDARLQRGVAWLKTHQRASGRWFTPSLNTYTTRNLTSNSGAAFAVLALQACGEIPERHGTNPAALRD